MENKEVELSLGDVAGYLYPKVGFNEAEVAGIVDKTPSVVRGWRGKTRPYKNSVGQGRTYKLEEFLKVVAITEILKEKGLNISDIRGGDLMRLTDGVLRIGIDLLTRESTFKLLKEMKEKKKVKKSPRYRF